MAKKQRHRRTLLPAAGIITLLLSSACAASAEGEASANGSDDVELTFLHTQPEGALDEAIAIFESTFPNITIDSQTLPFNDLSQQIEARLSSGDDSIDVIAVDPPRLPTMVEKGYLESLEDNRAELEEAVSAVALNSSTWDDEVWTSPLFTSSGFLFYNKDLLDQAGQDYPSADPAERLTFEELRVLAEDAQDAGAQYGMSFDQVDRAYQLLPLLESAGAGSGVDDEGNAINVTNETFIETADWYGDLYSSGLSPRGVTVPESPGQFIAGQVAYFIGGSARMKSFNAEDALNYGVAPHPMFESGEPATPTDSWSLGVSKHSSHVEAAKEFVVFMATSVDAAEASSLGTSFPPTNEEAFDTYLELMEQNADGRADGYSELFRHELENTATHRPSTVHYVDYEVEFEKTFNDIRNGTPASQALKGMQERLEPVFAN